MATAFFRTVILYLLLIAGLRLSGKRQIGELEPIELVLTLLISDLASVPMQDFGLRRILHKHLKYESPYNTYRNKGLPPSPICMPGIDAIDAVLNYEVHDYLFFCARATFDGYHNFARTLREHNANARAYSAELNRRKIK